jgi:hypothetical protein
MKPKRASDSPTAHFALPVYGVGEEVVSALTNKYATLVIRAPAETEFINKYKNMLTVNKITKISNVVQEENRFRSMVGSIQSQSAQSCSN